TIFQYRFGVTNGGVLTNTVNGLALSANSFLSPNSAACALTFTDSGGSSVSTYGVSSNVFVQLNDMDANLNNLAINTVTVTVRNTSNGDQESITLTETGLATGIFRNTSPLPSSLTVGGGQQDGT